LAWAVNLLLCAGCSSSGGTANPVTADGGPSAGGGTGGRTAGGQTGGAPGGGTSASAGGAGGRTAGGQTGGATATLPPNADGIPTGNPDGHCDIPAEAALEDVSTPTTVIGTGTAASCTGAAFVSAVAAGGVITFNCGADPAVITLT